jgi:ribonuclease VapC
MTTRRVFDSSALLALIFDEPGAAKAEALLHEGEALVSAANVAELLAKLIDQGLTDAEARAVHDSLLLEVAPLSEEIALAAGRLRRQTRALGLSLGDRCCLALAQATGAVVVTADRPWKALKDFRFEFIR